MSEKEKTEGKTIELEPEKTGTEGINPTEFVEPDSKGRRIVKYVIGGLAAVVTGIAGFLLGKASAKDDGETQEDTASEKTTEE